MSADDHTKLIHSHYAVTLSNRTVNALSRAGILTWGELVREAGRTPNVVRSIEGLGPKGVSEVITALNTAKVTHTIKTRRR